MPRAYHFLPANYALENVYHRRLKIAQFNELNDPFDLWAIAQRDRQLRRAIRNWKQEMATKYGMLCFSRSWRNPLLWSHYGNRHHGMVLGFDVGRGLLEDVVYTKQRPVLEAVNEETVHHLLYTKFIDWKYEEEIRVFTRLKDKDPGSGLYFARFGVNLRLREVIVGPLCSVAEKAVQDALGQRRRNVAITKARLAFNSFNVVRNRMGFPKV
jgi:hypothetical protein